MVMALDGDKLQRFSFRKLRSVLRTHCIHRVTDQSYVLPIPSTR